MSTLDAALRGGAILVLLLRIVMLARNAGADQVSRYAALLLAGIAAYVAESASGFGKLDLVWRLPIQIVSVATPAMFWIATGAIFIDEFRARWYHAFAWLVLAVLGGVEMWSHPTSVSATQSALSVFFVLLGIWNALAGRASDLVEGRRRLRILVAVVIALYTVLIVASDWLWRGGLSAPQLSLGNAIGLVTLVFLFSVLNWLPATEESLAPTAASVGPAQSLGAAPPAIQPVTGADVVLIVALRKLFEHGKIHRDQELSIASLAQQLDIPEYRLRRLINRQLGHRNFNTFVNGYRLAEAETALSDPDQADVPILTIALDAGFGSIGPFNRAFKAQTGLTPTEYRRAHSGNDQPPSGFG